MSQINEASPLSAALNYTVAADRFSGAASLRVALDLPSSRNGFGPALSLVYGSARRQGVFGRGWSLSGVPVIGVDASETLPSYDGRDGISSSVAGSLVRERNAAGDPVRRATDGFTIERFRARDDSARMRFERWTETATGQIHWRSWDTGNVQTIYGRSAATQVADPDTPGRVYQWLPEITVNDRGDALAYDYAAEDDRGRDAGRAFDVGRPAGAQRHPKSLRWGNVTPVTDAAAVDQDAIDWAFSAVFDYGDHDPAAPAFAPDRDWPARPDPFSTGTAGFELRTWRLCRRILVFHRFDPLGPDPVLTRAIDLNYDERTDGTRLISVVKTGYRGTGAARQARSVPPVSFTYTEPDLAETFAPVSAQLQATAPEFMTTAGTRLVDLYSEGLPGILHQSRSGWEFQRNLGGGRFSPPLLVQARPAHSLASVSIGDFDGDGAMDAVVLSGQGAGHYRFDASSDSWGNFQPFEAMPAEAALGGLERLDLTGDGRSDLIRRTSGGLKIYESLGAKGFAQHSKDVHLTANAAQGPTGAPPLLTDTETDFLFADMTGDGLADHVMIRDGSVIYWPSLGRGRFAAAVTMENAPRLTTQGRFAIDRILLADLTGSGTADLIHIGEGEIRIFYNEAGNRFSAPRVLGGLPMIDTSSILDVRDVLGDGRQSLVWAEHRAGRIASYQTLGLSAPVPPGLIETVENGMGRRERVVYGNSVAHYLRDQHTEHHWTTNLPRHVVTVDMIARDDLITGTTIETRLEYRNGAFDGRQRVFAGFAEVDTLDSEFAEDLETALPTTVPLLTRAFFDLGLGQESHHRFWQGDGAALMLDAYTLDAGGLTVPLDADSALDARAALRGREIRTELFAMTETGPEEVPIAVEQKGYVVRVEQAAGPVGREGIRHPLERSVHTVLDREAARLLYEGVADDPRVSHDVILDSDQYGAMRLAVQLSYPRRPGPVREDPGQDRLSCLIKRVQMAHDTTQDIWALNRPVSQEEFSVSGLTAPTRGWFRFDEIAPIVEGALLAPLDHDTPQVSGRAVRTSWSRRLFVGANGIDAASLGDASQPARLHHTETACFTEAFATTQFGAGIETRLPGLGYTLSDGYWWNASEVILYHPPDRFFLPAGHQLSDGRSVDMEYDDPALHTVRVTDPFGAVATTKIDYAALAPHRTDSPTGAWTETIHDALGLPVRASCGGTVVDTNDVEQTWGFDPATPGGEPTFNDALTDPIASLGNQSEILVYDLDAYQRDGSPPAVLNVLASDLVHDGAGGAQTGGHVSVEVSYFDGFGQTALSKQRAEAGEAVFRDGTGALSVGPDGSLDTRQAAIRWRSSGWSRRNAKGESIESFEPYFSETPNYEDDAELRSHGRATRRFYDAAGRLVQTLFPGGTVERSEHGAWTERFYDANDTVATSAWRLARDILPASDPERHALDVTLPHSDTPVERILDSEGRQVRTRESDGLGGHREVRSILLETGESARDIDARGIETGRHVYDMAGRKCVEWSADAGETRVLFDARDNPVETISAGSVVRTTTYDALDRPLFVTVDTGDGPRRIESVDYADDPTDASVIARNLFGLAIETRDEAGRHRVLDALPSGHVTRTAWELVSDPLSDVDWSGGVSLDDEVFEASVRHDAQGRPVEERNPDESVIRTAYSEGGAIARLSVSTTDGRVGDTDVLRNVQHSVYGERERVEYGNGVTVARAFEDGTRLVRRIHATRSSAGGRPPLLQDLRLIYDPIGNVTGSVDLAHGDGARAVFTGTAGADAARSYTYDAFYRLTRAEGRAHGAFTATPGPTPVLPLSDGTGTERFAQSYTYDLSGNLTRLRHSGTIANFTTNFWVDAASNRSRPTTRPDGTPVDDATAAAEFGAGGEMRQVDHLENLVWRHDQRLLRVVVVDRSGQSRPDDDEVYLYDGSGMRLRKITRRLLGDGSVERVEVTYLGDAERRRIFRGDTLILERFVTRLSDGISEFAELHRWTIDTTARETTDPTSTRLRYTLSDHLGSATLRLDEAARVVSYEEYMPYGQTAFAAADSARETALKAYGFIQRERDATTGFHHIGQRYYASWLCRWISPDPGGSIDGPNLYIYARANPVSHFDRSGLQTTRTRPGRRYAAPARPDPPAVTAALSQQSPRTQVRYMMNQITWYIDSEGTVHFGTRAELERIVSRDQANGADIIVLGAAGRGNEGGDGGGGSGTGTGAGDPEAPGGDPAGDTPDAPPDPGGGTGSPQADGTGTDPTAEGTAPDSGGQQGGTDDATGTEGTGENELGAEDGDPEGTGTVAGSDHQGPGGGGTSEDPNALGRGDAGTGRGGGTGDPQSRGTGQEDSPAHREGGTGRGTGSDPGGTEGGTGTEGGGTNPEAGGTNPDATGTAPGGSEGGTGTEPGGGPGGAEGGGPGGGDQGSPSGDPEGTAETGDAGSGTGGNGGDSSAPPGSPPSENSGGANGNSASGNSGGNRPPNQEGQSGSEGPGGQEPATVMDHVARVAGWWNLEFGSDEPGESGGIPGGMGSLNLGAWGQAAFVALTVVDIALTVVSLGSLAALKASLKVALKASMRALASAGRRVMSALSLKNLRNLVARSGLRAGINWNPFRSRMLREFLPQVASRMSQGGYRVDYIPRLWSVVKSKVVNWRAFSSPTGSRIWSSAETVAQSHVDDLVRHLDNMPGSGVINVLTGRHGTAAGFDLGQREAKFFIDDLMGLPSSARIDIHDITRLTDSQLSAILQHSDDVVLAWCHSESSRRVLRALGLNFRGGAPF